MLRSMLASFGLSFTLLLSACGGDGGGSATGDPGPGSGAVSSSVVKGLIRNGVVRLMRWQDGAYVEVAHATTDTAGAYRLIVPNPVPGEVLRLDLELSADASKPTQMRCDAVACGSTAFGDWAPMTSAPGLHSWVSVDANGNAIVMPMTPVSTLLVAYAERAGAGHMDAASLAAAKQRVAALFGFASDADLLAKPGNVADGLFMNAASERVVRMSLLASAFAQLASSGNLQEVISDYSTSFADNDGRLMQAGGGSPTLDDIFGAMQGVLPSIINRAGSPVWQASVTAWITRAKAALQAGKLSYDSDRFLSALGTGEDTLGGDLRRVMGEQNALTLEALVAQQLSQFGWLASGDTVAIAGVAVQAVGYGLTGALGQTGTMTQNGLTVTAAAVQNGNDVAVHIQGVQNGMTVNMDITVPNLAQRMLGAALSNGIMSPVFNIAVRNGVLENANVKATIDGSLVINATGTDFSALLLALQNTDDPNALGKGVASLLRNGKATFTLQGHAGIVKKSNNSELSIAGLGALTVDMAGGTDGAISATGYADHGVITLPNNATLSIDKSKGEYLKFELGQDGTLETRFKAFLLNHVGNVTANGALAELGPLLTNLRNSVATALESGSGDLSTVVDQLLTDLSFIRLTFGGQAVIPDYNHTYTLSYADGQMVLSQPNSSDAALTLIFDDSGILAKAGDKWWQVGLDLADIAHPAITLADDTGGEWRWEFDFSGLLAQQMPVQEQEQQVPSNCYGTTQFC